MYIIPLSANPTKWSNTLKQFVAKLPTNCLSVFDHFLGLALKGLTSQGYVTCKFSTRAEIHPEPNSTLPMVKVLFVVTC